MARSTVRKVDLYQAGLARRIRPDLGDTFCGLLSRRSQAGGNLFLSHAEQIRLGFRSRALQRASGHRQAADQCDVGI